MGAKMGVAETIENFLKNRNIDYQVIENSKKEEIKSSNQKGYFSENQVAKSIFLGDESSYLLVIIPSTHRLEQDRLNQILARNLENIEKDEAAGTFNDCDEGCIPTFGEPYGIDSVIDASLMHEETIFANSGKKKSLIKISGKDFRMLCKKITRVQVSHHL
tara:strand:- start:110 stop:592 length:483 start_codon:yes stop_codon:yes gene_type:complete